MMKNMRENEDDWNKKKIMDRQYWPSQVIRAGWVGVALSSVVMLLAPVAYNLGGYLKNYDREIEVREVQPERNFVPATQPYREVAEAKKKKLVFN
jgi:hypothetical protein